MLTEKFGVQIVGNGMMGLSGINLSYGYGLGLQKFPAASAQAGFWRMDGFPFALTLVPGHIKIYHASLIVLVIDLYFLCKRGFG